MRSWPIREALAVLFVLAVIIGFGGETVRLICTRTEPGQPVTCVKQTSLFWTIPLGEQELNDVRGASVHEDRGTGPEDPDTTYNIQLATREGHVQLTFVSRLRSPPDATAERINAFLRTSTDTNLVITDAGWILSGGFWCIICVLPFVIAVYSLLLIREKTRRAMIGDEKAKT